MSFSSDVKEELVKNIGKGRHCQIAELSALLLFDGKVGAEDGHEAIRTRQDNQRLLAKYHALLEEIFAGKDATAELVAKTVKMWDEKRGRVIIPVTVNRLLVQQSCCRRAFIRGAFLAGGSISDPDKSYHFEIVCGNLEMAEQLKEFINTFDMDAKIVGRKQQYVVYLKEGSQIVDMLNVMGAHVALMNLENVRILKEMRNSVNRKVNCETANISKTVNAAVRQREDIIYISKKAGLSSLPDNLQEIARLRLAYPEAPLKELGSYLDPPVGKSGVNHRLKKISRIAEEMRD